MPKFEVMAEKCGCLFRKTPVEDWVRMLTCRIHSRAALRDEDLRGRIESLERRLRGED